HVHERNEDAPFTHDVGASGDDQKESAAPDSGLKKNENQDTAEGQEYHDAEEACDIKGHEGEEKDETIRNFEIGTSAEKWVETEA
ncbi:unnamed protein product, partial [Amoebophrya sp. A25]